MSKQKLNDYNSFKNILDNAEKIVAFTGAEVSSESGIPIFKGRSGFWKTHSVLSLATPKAFKCDPTLIWDFYNHQRSIAFQANPNNAHKALAKFEEECASTNRQFHIITQNTDGLHQKAGSKNIIELHGTLRKIKCTDHRCNYVEELLDNPMISGKLEGDLPKCKKCGKLARPNVTWFGEGLDPFSADKARELIEACDVCLVVGTSSSVYPAALFAPLVAEKGRPVAEFNQERHCSDEDFQFHFKGPCGLTLPKALGYEHL